MTDEQLGSQKQASNRKFEEVTERIDPVFHGKVISLQVEHVRLPNGETATREVIKHPGAVAILAIHENRMLVVEQYRKPIERSMVEIPAGKLDPGEEPVHAAARELEEETGFKAGSLRLLQSFYTAPGFADEVIHLYLADDLYQGEANPDEDEFLDVGRLTLEQAKQDILDGRIMDAKTIMAVYAWEIQQRSGRS